MHPPDYSTVKCTHIDKGDTKMKKGLLFGALLSGLPGKTLGQLLQGRSSKPSKECALPECNKKTRHNGGYCSADHCREDARRKKQPKEVCKIRSIIGSSVNG